MRILLALLVYLLVETCHGAKECNYDSQAWQPKWSNEIRNDLRCNVNNCDGIIDDQSIDACCSCQSCVTWEGNAVDLFIEFISPLGNNLVISDRSFNKSVTYRIEYAGFSMTKIPSNICDWENETRLSELYTSSFYKIREFWGNIVEIDLSDNNIRYIPDINCLKRLDKLYLNDNRISHVSNTSFTSLSRLRYLELNGNAMTSLDLNILSAPQLHVFFTDFTQNELQTLDLSNILLAYPFCSVAFAGNKIRTVENEGFKVDFDALYGPGFIDMADNLITEFPNYKELLNFDSWEQAGKFFFFGVDLSNIPLICDCNLQPLLEKGQDTMRMFLHNDSKDVTCTAPPSMKGKSIFIIDQEKLICNLTNCQSQHCTCVDKPLDDTLYVTCESGLDKLPELPDSRHSQFVSLNVSGNNIKEITNVTYLSRLVSLDISNNDLREISDNVTKALEENCKFLDISDNPKLTRLPKLFQYRDVCRTRMKNLEIDCNCQTTWIETWLHQNICSADNLFKCNVPKIGVTLATNFHESDLECFVDMFNLILATTIASVTLVMIITGFSVYNFYYEIQIVYLRLRQRKRNDIEPNFKYDVFISFNENEERVTRWVVNSLNKHLVDKGYTSFIAIRDLQYGTDRTSDVISAIENSRNFLIILSEGYLEQADEGMRSWTENEWKFGWNNFSQDRCKNIILVNYDHMEASGVAHPVIKAYVRVGCTVDFENHERNIMHEIETKLGKLFRDPDIDTDFLENKNMLSPTHLFVTGTCEDDLSDLELEDARTTPAIERPQPRFHKQHVDCDILHIHPGTLKPRHGCHRYGDCHVVTTSV